MEHRWFYIGAYSYTNNAWREAQYLPSQTKAEQVLIWPVQYWSDLKKTIQINKRSINQASQTTHLYSSEYRCSKNSKTKINAVNEK